MQEHCWCSFCHQSELGISGFNHGFVFFFSLNMCSPLSLSCSTGQYTSVSSVFQVPRVQILSNPRTSGREQMLWMWSARGRPGLLWELTLRCHSTHCVNPSRIYGFVWSVATSVVAVMSADTPTNTLRKHNIRMQCSSQTTASGTMLEVCTYLRERERLKTIYNFRVLLKKDGFFNYFGN